MQKLTKIKVWQFLSCNCNFVKTNKKCYSLNSFENINDSSSDNPSSFKTKQLHIPVMLNEVITHLVDDMGHLDSAKSSNKVK